MNPALSTTRPSLQPMALCRLAMTALGYDLIRRRRLKRASDTRASRGKSRVIATVGRVGRWTLVVIVLCLALVAFLHLTRGTAVRHDRGVAADGSPISVSEPPIADAGCSESAVARFYKPLTGYGAAV
jgi:hypothetical protein